MKINGWLVQLIIAFVVSLSCFGQLPPPNDNFSNRTILSGTDVVFGGTLAGATIEDPRETQAYPTYPGSVPPLLPTQSVWWSWTAPTNTWLTLQILSSSLNDFSVIPVTYVFIYTATNGGNSTSNLDLPPLGTKFVQLRVSPQTMTIPVTAGTEYLIQLIGAASASYTCRLAATNTPVIVQQPRNRTVNSNQNVLLCVFSAGVSLPTFAFQWRFNGTNLDGETGAMLALTNMDDSRAGVYSVVVSNSYGFIISDPAIVAVGHSNTPISVAAVDTSPDSIRFSLNGEKGRAYRIESSTDLVNWSPERSFWKKPYDNHAEFITSVVLNPNSPFPLEVRNNSTRKYFRASPFVPSPADVDVCQFHIQILQAAKLLWQRDNNYLSHYTPYLSDILPYLPGHSAPLCPLDFYQTFDTSYRMYSIEWEPTCIVYPTTHFVEEPY